MDRGIDKGKTAFTTTIDYMSNAAKMVNLGSQTIKFCCLIPNHPSLTLRLLYMYMIMQLRWGPRDCCKRNFNPSTVPQSDSRRRAASHWALPHISSLCIIRQ